MTQVTPAALNAVIRSGQPTPGFYTLGSTVNVKVGIPFATNAQNALTAAAVPVQQVASDGVNVTFQLL
jgi:hypothetical protein